jgi:hypothetical protein
VRIIEVRPSKKLSGWIAFEAPGVEPAFSGPNGKQDAISFAANRFNGSAGEVRVYDEFGLTLLDTITIEGRGHDPQAEFLKGLRKKLPFRPATAEPYHGPKT